jgi:hypothetical protein
MDASWDASFGDIYFNSDNCLHDSAGNTLTCCTERAIYAEVANPYYNPTPAATCGDANNWLYITFGVWGKGWVSDGGASLKQQVEGCGAVTGWSFSSSTDIEQDGSSNNIGTYQAEFFAEFNLPTTFKEGCVGRAIQSAGGPSGVGCSCDGLEACTGL